MPVLPLADKVVYYIDATKGCCRRMVFSLFLLLSFSSFPKEFVCKNVIDHFLNVIITLLLIFEVGMTCFRR
jgi:hypothetical protein